MVPIKIGIVGYGIMGEMYAQALEKNPLASVAAVANRGAERRSLAVTKHGCPVFKSYQDMYDAGGLDAVLICVPDHLHRDPVVRAAEAGLHMLVEKPFATSIKDAEAMVKAIERSGVKCMVEFFNRWSAPFVEARNAVQRGDLGDVLSVATDLNDTIFVPTKMLSWAESTSPAWFLMSHSADLVSWITGKVPVAVQAMGVKQILVEKGINTYDLIEALVEYDDGAVGRFTNCWVLPGGMPLIYELKMRIVGSKAAIDIDTSDQQVHLITQDRLSHPVTAWGDIQGRLVGHPYEMLDAFVRNIVDDTEPLVGPMAGWRNTMFLAAVHEAVESGKRVPVRQ